MACSSPLIETWSRKELSMAEGRVAEFLQLYRLARDILARLGRYKRLFQVMVGNNHLECITAGMNQVYE